MAYLGPNSQLQAWLEAGLAAHHRGDLDQALAAYRQVLVMSPEHAPALNLLGTGLLQLGQPGEAVPYLERAARRQRGDPRLLANLAQAYLALGRHGEACETFRKASRLAPGEAQLHVGCAAALAMQGKLAEAESMLRRITTRFPDSAAAWYNLGNVLRDAQQPHDAITAYEKALELEAGHVDARNALGSVLHSLQRFAEAERHYRECLRRAPGYRRALFNLASVVIDLGRFTEAESLCRDIVAVEPLTPESHAFLGTTLAHQGRLLEAMPCHREAARLAPDNVRSRAIYGSILTEVGRFAEGRRLLADAIVDGADTDASRLMLTTALLAHGALQDGWGDYALRPAAQRFREKYPEAALSVALPADLRGRSVCVLREQGLGDEIFFLRYARVLAERGARVAYRASGKIASLIARAAFIDELLPEGGAVPAADACILVGDLPHALGKTPSSPVPAPAGPRAAATREWTERISLYWPAVPASIEIAPVPEKLTALRERLATLGPPPYIGVTWRAGTPPQDQGADSWLLYKEVGLEALGRALSRAGGTFLALQRKPAAGEIERLAEALGKPLHDLTALNEDLEDMLALLALIDDYVGVSNTNMHLRAAAGKSARVFVPLPAEWRWMQSRTASPWFAGFRVYRQSLQGDWSGALAGLADDLGLNSDERGGMSHV